MLRKAVQQGRSGRRGEEVPTELCVAVHPYNDSWRTENTLQFFRASERRENTAGRLFQHPVSWFHTGLRHRLQGMGDSPDRSRVDVRHVSLVAPLKTGDDILAGVMRITSELLQLPDSEKDSKSEGLWSPTALQPWSLLYLRRNPPSLLRRSSSATKAGSVSSFAKASEDTRYAFLHSFTDVASCVGG